MHYRSGLVQTSTWNFDIIINKIVQNNNISPMRKTKLSFGIFLKFSLEPFKTISWDNSASTIKGAKIAKEFLGNFVQGQPKVPGGYVQGPISSSILFKLYSIGDKLFVFVNSTTW